MGIRDLYGIATAYAKEGTNIVITGRNTKNLEDAKEELARLYGVKVLPVQADVSVGADNEAVVQHVIDETIKTFGHINVLINNAQASASVCHWPPTPRRILILPSIPVCTPISTI